MYIDTGYWIIRQQVCIFIYLGKIRVIGHSSVSAQITIYNFTMTIKTFQQDTLFFNIFIQQGLHFRFHIKPFLIHFPVCWLHVNPWPVHPVSMHPWHLPEVISQVGWGSRQSKSLVQPRISYLKGNVLEKNALFFFYTYIWILSIEFYRNLQRNFVNTF